MTSWWRQRICVTDVGWWRFHIVGRQVLYVSQKTPIETNWKPTSLLLKRQQSSVFIQSCHALKFLLAWIKAHISKCEKQIKNKSLNLYLSLGCIEICILVSRSVTTQKYLWQWQWTTICRRLHKTEFLEKSKCVGYLWVCTHLRILAFWLACCKHAQLGWISEPPKTFLRLFVCFSTLSWRISKCLWRRIYGYGFCCPDSGLTGSRCRDDMP